VLLLAGLPGLIHQPAPFALLAPCAWQLLALALQGPPCRLALRSRLISTRLGARLCALRRASRHDQLVHRFAVRKLLVLEPSPRPTPRDARALESTHHQLAR
jgi:hypothetical protein